MILIGSGKSHCKIINNNNNNNNNNYEKDHSVQQNGKGA